MCDKAVHTYSSTIKFVPECFMTQEMCDKAVNRCFFIFDSIPEKNSRNTALINIKPKRMCDKAVHDSLTVLKLILD